MKMDRMVEYLENRGFKAERRYDKRNRVYTFTVSKNGLSVTDDFKYPGTADYSIVDKEQRKFLDHMIDFWKRTLNAAYGSKPTNGIDWHINNIDWDYLTGGNSSYHIDLTATIVGEVNTPYKSFHDYLEAKLNGLDTAMPEIANVIFNDPATIVFWNDGTKTVVKCQDGDAFDPEKGLAMAISKKALGNRGNYCEVFKKWCFDQDEVERIALEEAFNEIKKKIEMLSKKF